jgi:hypothetical protein
MDPGSARQAALGRDDDEHHREAALEISILLR